MRAEDSEPVCTGSVSTGSGSCVKPSSSSCGCCPDERLGSENVVDGRGSNVMLLAPAAGSLRGLPRVLAGGGGAGGRGGESSKKHRGGCGERRPRAALGRAGGGEIVGAGGGEGGASEGEAGAGGKEDEPAEKEEEGPLVGGLEVFPDLCEGEE